MSVPGREPLGTCSGSQLWGGHGRDDEDGLDAGGYIGRGPFNKSCWWTGASLFYYYMFVSSFISSVDLYSYS